MSRILVFSLVLAALTSGCSESPPPPPEAERHAEHEAPAVPESVKLSSAAIAEAGIQTWKVQPVDLAHALVLNGTVGVDENRSIDVASNVGGRVASLPVDLGARVASGEPVAWIESVELSHAWDAFVRAVADRRLAAASRDRARKLHEQGVLGAADLEAAEAADVAARAEAGAAERTLRMYGEPDDEIAAVRGDAEAGRSAAADGAPHRIALRAPFRGRVVARRVTPGSLVEPLQPLVTVVDLGKVWVFLHVYEKDLAATHEGLDVAIRTEAYPQERFRGRIDFVGGTVDESMRTVRVRAVVDNPGERLKPGMFVTATVNVPRPENERHDVLAVPQAAVQTLEGRTVLFAAAGPGAFVRRFVETGHTFEGLTEILAGVAIGDEVVTEGSFVLKGEFAKASLAEEH
ncbi:MAG TPA: efflux RND transporter periplasmic adaptor subunit [Candidatus Polarisedimenticolaceae bacterium]|nr:efflux RND transporter periplasmic adaptor subunit [Candidatus Polarisedimenticolaceae bacterium]